MEQSNDTNFDALKADASIYEHIFKIWTERLMDDETFGTDNIDNWLIGFENC